MRYVFYCFIFILPSCQSKENASVDNKISDSTQTSTTQIDNLNPVQTDSSLLIRKQKSDTIFLSFRIGMTRPKFEKHKQELVQKRKLKVSDKGLIYQIKIDISDHNPFDFGKDNIPEEIWTGNGIVLPEFFDNKLISITIKFLNTRGDNVYWFFADKLDEKYYKSTPKLYNFDIAKMIETLQVGDSFNSHIRNNWLIGDINISLRFNSEYLKVADKEVKQKDNVVLKYWSEYYYNQRQDEKANEGKKETNEVENDL